MRVVRVEPLLMADVTELKRWAVDYIAAHPDDPRDPQRGFTVWVNGSLYLERWYVVPRNDAMNVYLHRFWRSDDDRALHDHRGDNRSVIIDGHYVEHALEGSQTRFAGDVVDRRATDLHRIELVDYRPVISLFFIGPIVRNWGFRCLDGRWIPWREFVSVVPGGNALGKGCG